MRIKLKTLVLLGYLLLAIIAVVLSATGIYFIEKLSKTPDSILKDNYKSIVAAQNMIDQLDNMDNSVVTYLSSKNQKASNERQYNEARAKYVENLKICENNVTEPGEGDLVKELHKASDEYIDMFSNQRVKIISIEAYDSLVLPKYLAAKGKCYELLRLNHKGMLMRRDDAVDTSKTAEIYMIVISAISILIVLAALFRVPTLVVNPIKEFTERVEAISNKKYSERLNLRSNNELGALARSIDVMAEKLEDYEKSNIEKLIGARRRAEAIVKSMVDGIIVLDENNDVLLINKVCAELLGLTEEDILRKNIFKLCESNNLLKSLVKDFDDENQTEKDRLNYIRIVYKEREEFFLKETVDVVDEEMSNKILGRIIILKNVTGFKELDELRGGFIATVSHELRTPLAAMNMSLRLLQDERIGTLNAEQKRITNAMKEEVKRLLKFVNELLNLAKIESGGDILKYQRVKVDEIMDAAITPMLMQFEQKNIDFHPEIEEGLPDIKVDANKIAWVIINLLNNAIRYSQDGGRIDFKVWHEGNKILFCVRDFGIGIEPQTLSKVFEKFVQLKEKNLESHAKGVGLGLAISKEFVNAHGGEIWVKSEPGKGSEFYFSLPL